MERYLDNIFYLVSYCMQLFDVLVEKKLTNIAHSEVGLELHMDLPYYQSPPGLQLLHCLKYRERDIYMRERDEYS